MKNILINKSDYNFNPFSGVLSEDIDEIIVPRFESKKLVDLIMIEMKMTTNLGFSVNYKGEFGVIKE